MIITKKNYDLTVSLILIAAGWIVYFNSLNVPFFFDDLEHIRYSSRIFNIFSIDTIINSLFGSDTFRRPVSNFTFLLNYLTGGYNVTGFHIVNITIHISNALILYFLFDITLSLPINRKKYKEYKNLAFVVALIWLLHPLATQSVTYIIQRANSMATMFYLLSLLFFIKGRFITISINYDVKHQIIKRLYFGLSLISGLLAIGSKEIAVTLPITIFIYEWYFLQNLEWKWLKKKIIWLLAALLIVIFWVFLYLGKNPLSAIIHSCDNRDFTTTERLLTQLRVVTHYISLIFYPNPDRLTLDYNFPISTSLINPVTTLSSFIIIVTLLLASLIIAKKERLLSFCILWFFINLVIESSFICLEMIFEHRTYLPSTFFLLGIVIIGYRLLKVNILVILSLTIIVTIFGYWTIVRNLAWQDHLTFWTDAVKKAPGKARPLCNLGNAYYHVKEYKKAIEYYNKALAIKPDFPYVYKNMGLAFIQLGEFEKAEESYRDVLKFHPNYVDALNDLAAVLVRQDRVKEAIRYYRIALSYAPGYLPVNKHLGEVLLRIGKVRLALYFLSNSLPAYPEDIGLHLSIGEVFMKLGQNEEAERVYRHILELSPENAAAHYNLAILLSRSGNEGESMFHYQEAIRNNPFNIPALYNLGNIRLRNGDLDAAAKNYEKILSMLPELVNTYNNYGLLLRKKGKYHEAIQCFKTVLRIMPGHKLAKDNLETLQELVSKETNPND